MMQPCSHEAGGTAYGVHPPLLPTRPLLLSGTCAVELLGLTCRLDGHGQRGGCGGIFLDKGPNDQIGTSLQKVRVPGDAAGGQEEITIGEENGIDGKSGLRRRESDFPEALSAAILQYIESGPNNFGIYGILKTSGDPGGG